MNILYPLTLSQSGLRQACQGACNPANKQNFMKKLHLPLKAIGIIILVVMMGIRSEGATINITSTINWSAITGGSGAGGQPTSADIINVYSNRTLTVDVSNAVCGSLQLGRLNSSSNSYGMLTFSGTDPALTVTSTGGLSGYVSLGGFRDTDNDGTITFTSTATLTAVRVILGSTSTNKPAQGIINMTAGGTLICESMVSNTSNDVFTEGTGTVKFTGTFSLGLTDVGNELGSFYNLHINSGIVTYAKNITILSDLLISTGATLDLSTFTSNRSSTGGTLTVAGTLLLGGTTGGAGSVIPGSNFPSNFTTHSMTGGTVNYDNTSGGQTVFNTPAYNNLTLGNSSGTQTAGGNITVNGTLTTFAGGTLNMVANQLLGTLAGIINGGTIQTQNTSTTPVPSGKTWDGTVQYNATTGAQTVMAGNYLNLTLGNTSNTQTASGNITVNGTLTTTSGGTFNLVTYQLLGALAIISNNGTIQTQNTSTTPIPTGNTWGGTVQYNAASGLQTIMAGTYATLLLSNTSGTQTASGDITVNAALTTTASGIFNMAAYQLLGSLSTITNNGTIQTQNTSGTPIPTGKTWGGTVNYNASTGGQTVATGTYNNLSLGNTSGNQSAVGNLTVNGTLTTTSGGTLNMSTNQLLGTLNTITNGGTIQTQNTSGTPIPTGKTWGGTVNYNAANGGQTVMPGTYSTLTVANTSGTQTASGDISAATLNTTAGGTLNMVTYALSGLSSVGNSGTLRTQNISEKPFTSGLTWGGTVTFDGSAIQNLPEPASIFNNLTISNTTGVISKDDQTVSGILSLTTNPNSTTGNLDMAAYTLEMGLTGTTTGLGDVSGVVKRSGTPVGNVPYSFGSQYTSLTFINTGTKPNWVACKLVLGSALPNKPGSILRHYSFAADASSYTDEVILNLHYLDGSELNGTNTETKLVIWDDHIPVIHEHGRSAHNETENWVELAGISISYLAPTTGYSTKLWSLADYAATKNTWSGANNTEWNNTLNWTGGIPTATSDVLIPAGMPRYPILTASSNAEAKTIEIEAAASLTASGQNLTIYGFTGALLNDGTFTQSGSGKVVFANGTLANQVTISGTGTTNFYTIETTLNTYLQPAVGTTIGIAGSIEQTAGSIIDLTATVNTVNYNGAAQTLTDPIGPGSDKGYYNLTLTGSTGAKTFPSSLTIAGDFTNNLSGGTITAGTSTVTMNGVGHAQNIGGTSSTATAFANLTIANTTAEVTTTANITIASTKFLTIDADAVFTPGATKTVGGAGILTGYGTAKVTMINSGSDLFSQYTLASLILTNLTVDFIGSGDQTIDAWDYFNLTISANGTRTVSLAEYNGLPDSKIYISGTFLPNIANSYIVINSTVVFNGTLTQTIPAFNFYNLSSTSAAAARILSNSGIIGIAGAFDPSTNAYTIVGSTINFNGLAQTIPTFTYNNLTVSTASYTKIAEGNLYVNGTLTVASSVTLNMSIFALLGTLNTISNSGTIKTSVYSTNSNLPLPEGKTWGGIVEYFCTTGGKTQIISSGTYNNLTMSGNKGKVANGDITVNGILSLVANQLATQGILETGSYTLYLGVSSSITGVGDVTGIVKREHVFTGNTAYSFGNQYTTLTFVNTGSKPNWVSCKIAIGEAPGWKSDAVQRYYSFAQDGSGDDRVIANLHYLTGELNSLDENNVVFWDAHNGPTFAVFHPHGKTSNDATNDWVSLQGMSLLYLAPNSTINYKQWGLAYNNSGPITWIGIGAFPGDWSLPGNWSGGVPTATDDVLIPAGKPYYPYRNLQPLTAPAVAKTITIDEGASITSDGYDITVSGAPNAWVNNGTFFPGTGTVIFNNGNTSTPATIAGTTSFNNLNVAANTKIQPATASTIKIGNEIITGTGSILDFSTYTNTIEYYGSSPQTVLIPENGYSTLVLSGSGSKTLPSLNIKGDFINNGSFSAAGTTITMEGSIDQIISGTSASTFNNLTCDNSVGVTLSSDQLTTISGTLLINGGRKFNIGAGKYLTANTITNSGGNAGLTIKSDAYGTGSLLNSNSGVAATVERYIANDQLWHFLSTPVSSQPIWPQFAPDPGTDLSWDATPYNWDFYYYNPKALIASELYWVNLRNTGGVYNSGTDMATGSGAGYGIGTPNFVVGRGYLVAYTEGWTTNSPETHLFTGNLNTNISAQPISYLLGNTYNLMGNPYPSAIDWNASSGWSRASLTSSTEGDDFWIYNDASGNYGAFNGTAGTNGVSQFIAPGQAFFVKAASDGVLGMTDATRVHSIQEWLKKSSSENNLVRMTIENNANIYSDEMIVDFNPSYSNNHEGTEKFWSFYTVAPEIYSVKDGNNYSIDRYNTLTDDMKVDIAAKTGVAATYTITATNIDDFTLRDKVYLLDKKTGVKTNLKQTPSYSFAGTPDDDRNRFQLIFGTSIGVDEETNSDITIYASENIIYVRNDKANEPYTVMVSNMLGQIITRTKLAGNTLNQIELNRVPGIYVVTVYSEGSLFSRKVVVK